MLTVVDKDSQKKKTLKKLRLEFLKKKASSPELVLVDPATTFLHDKSAYMIIHTVGLVEMNHKVYSGPEFLNPYFDVTASIDSNLKLKTVRVDLSFNPRSAILPLDYTIKRLESYGDLELATWAHRTLKFAKNYERLVDDCCKLLESDDPKTKQILEDMKAQGERVGLELTNKYPFYKVTHCFGRKGAELVELSYSEDLLKFMGYSVEGFASLVNKSGFPAIFDAECSAYLQMSKNFLESKTLFSSSITEEPEYETIMFDSKGSKHRYIVQPIRVVEPSAEGFLFKVYFIVKSGYVRGKLQEGSQGNITIRKDQLNGYVNKRPKVQEKREETAKINESNINQDEAKQEQNN